MSVHQLFADRTDFGDEPNPLSRAIALARREGRTLLDLTVSNPTKCGFVYDEAALLQPLSSTQSLQYDADPLGMITARQSVVDAYYAPRSVPVTANRLLLTTSTSEGYGYLFRLLCNPGDEILISNPSYPLFDLLARINDVRPVSYPLLLHDDWRIDFAALRRSVGPRTRAIIVVHPNNPTGHPTHPEDRERLVAFAREHGLSLIVDEVFLDYPVELDTKPQSFAANVSPVLTFVLSGLSKVLALPQMKLAWIVVVGPEDQCMEALRRLEFIADTYLSVQAPVQHALAFWLPFAKSIQAQIRGRLRANLDALDRLLLPAKLLRRAPVEAGWCVLLRMPALEHSEEFALKLLRQAGVLVHPGSFYGLPDRGWLVLSLLPPPEIFEPAVSRIVTLVEQLANHES